MGRPDLRHGSHLKAEKPARQANSDAEMQDNAICSSSNDLLKGRRNGRSQGLTRIPYKPYLAPTVWTLAHVGSTLAELKAGTGGSQEVTLSYGQYFQ